MHRSTRFFASLGTVLIVGACSPPPPLPDPGIEVSGPQAAVSDLIAVDRAFAAAASERDGVHALTAMFAPNVIMPTPDNRFAEGATEAAEALQANPDNVRARLDWTPIRGGISADGEHGFTFGYMTAHTPGKPQVPMKYLAYWIRRPEGWRVAAYKRRPRAEGEVSLAMLPPAIPPALVPISVNTAEINRFRESLKEAEQAFSDSAQTMGIGAAFAHFASDDAVNMVGAETPGFIMGPDNIARAVSEGESGPGSPVSWSADRVIVASSGDLGVTFGTIRLNAPAPAGPPPPGIPYFTIWRRDSPRDPWRYVAE